ncbi:MAG: cupin domain-containing protein [Pseudomonadota bacterium]
MAGTSDADRIIEKLNLQPHPEGGWFRETFRDPQPQDGRGISTAIYYLLKAGERSHWHRIDAAEIWHFYAGGPLAITISANGHDAHAYRLGANVLSGDSPQVVVPANAWQTAEALGHWTLVGCTVAPAFDFETFELAPEDWFPTPQKA